jgi:hypothetical protein
LYASFIYASEFNSPDPDIIFKIKIPPPPGYMHLRVVLTWDSNPTPFGSATSENPPSDLDLWVTNGSKQMYCGSWNSNVEMVDIPATMFSPGETIDAHVIKTINRIPAGSRSGSFYYAIGWTWVQDHAEF